MNYFICSNFTQKNLNILSNTATTVTVNSVLFLYIDNEFVVVTL